MDQPLGGIPPLQHDAIERASRPRVGHELGRDEMRVDIDNGVGGHF
jgi:hypothetical protein